MGRSDWIRLCFTKSVMLRATKYALVVGGVLIAINHGDAILRGDLDSGRLLRMGLTILVPYTVSTLSSVGAMRELARSRNGGAAADW